MKRLGLAALPLAALLFAFGCTGGDKSGDKKPDTDKAQKAAQAKDEADIQGTWEVTSAEMDGKAMDEMKKTKVVITAKEITVKMGDKEMKMSYTLNANKDPKHIDTEEAKGDKKIKTEGVYQLEGDILKVAYPNDEAGKRPMEVTGKEGSKQRYMELKKETK